MSIEKEIAVEFGGSKVARSNWLVKVRGVHMRLSSFKSLSNFSLFVLAVSDRIISALSAIPKFSVIGNVFVNRSTDPMTVSYNKTLVPYAFSQCHVVQGNFSVDSRGSDHHYLYLNKSLDLVVWGAGQLITYFNTTVDWALMSSRCALQTAGQFLNHSFFCNTSDANLAVFYTPSTPYRKGIIGFLEQNASAVICKAGTGGFMVADYQPSYMPLTPSQPPQPQPDDSHSGSSFNMLLLIPIVGGSALLLYVAVGCANKEARSQIANLCHRWRGKGDAQRLLEMAVEKSHQGQYGAVDLQRS